MRNTLGWRTMARPIATRWRWPPESCLGLRCEQLLELQHARRLAHAPVDLVLGVVVQPQAEGHVLVDAQVRVERVVLEDHGDVAVARLQVVDDLVVDDDPCPS